MPILPLHKNEFEKSITKGNNFIKHKDVKKYFKMFI